MTYAHELQSPSEPDRTTYMPSTTTSAARTVADFVRSGDAKIVIDCGTHALSIERDDDCFSVIREQILPNDCGVAALLEALELSPTSPVRR